MTYPRLFVLSVYGGLIALAEIVVRLSETPDKYPSPLGVLSALTTNLLSGELFTAVEQSLSRILLAFAFAAVIGTLIGVSIGRFRWLDRAIGPFINALRSIAPIALIPLAVLWFGVTGTSAVFIVAYAAIFPIILNASEAARNVDMRLINAARTLGASRAFVLRRVVLPAAAPATITGARIAMGFAWASIVAAELAIGVKLETGGKIEAGIGQIMVSTLFVDRDVNGLVSYMLVIGLIGLGFDLGMRRLHRMRAPWEYA
ncbi:ABC transporter permease [Sulfitobacter mediterraneus]|uniref:ABC transporter permease n=1 Tax=Sulfitobacter mediterraneus TaxID=83219 RepID=UPI0021A2FCFF|nr:ABC transporter permease [Sulfitobacter mediterraneus]UWR13433.1 ABC transporter permease [Sulfitobacter mediterraneus]